MEARSVFPTGSRQRSRRLRRGADTTIRRAPLPHLLRLCLCGPRHVGAVRLRRRPTRSHLRGARIPLGLRGEPRHHAEVCAQLVDACGCRDLPPQLGKFLKPHDAEPAAKEHSQLPRKVDGSVEPASSPLPDGVSGPACFVTRHFRFH